MTTARAAARLCIAALLFSAAANAPADTIRGKVVKIADGDTLTLLDSANQQHRVRLAGIDAPERRPARV